MKELLLISCYIVAALEIGLGIYFWVTNSKLEVRRIMSYLNFSLGLWILSSLGISYGYNGIFFPILNAGVYLFGASLLLFLVHLSVMYPFPLIKIDRLHRILWYSPLMVILLITLTSKNLYLNFLLQDPFVNSGEIIAGPLVLHYNVVLFVLYVLTIVNFCIQYSRTSDYLRRNAKLILLSLIIGGLPAIWIDLVEPIAFSYNVSNFLVACLSTIIWSFTISFIVLEKH